MENAKGASPNWPLLGGIRFFLALIVAMCHLGMVLDGSGTYYVKFAPRAAVYLFFAISGFSIAASFERAPAEFYRRRFWRIAPMYWVGCAMAYLPFVIVRGGTSIPYTFNFALEIPAPWQVVAQFAFLQPGIARTPPANTSLWSVGVEAAFYVLVPLFARLKPFWLLPVILLSAFWYAHEPLLFITDPDITLYARSIWAFLAGWLLYQHRTQWKAQAALPLLFGIVYTFHDSGEETLALPLVVAVGILIAFNHRFKMSPRAARIAEYLGDLSFPLYVVHWPLAWCANFMNLDIQPATFILVVIAVAVPCLHFVDRPLRALGKKSAASPVNESAEQVAAQ